MFCCESCRDEAHKQYHKIECQYLNLLIEKETERETLLAMRVVLKLSKQGDNQRFNEMMHNKLYKKTLFIPRQKFHGNKIDPTDETILCELTDNFWRLNKDQQKELCNTITDLLHLLKTTTLFNDDAVSSRSSNNAQLLEVTGPSRALGNEGYPSGSNQPPDQVSSPDYSASVA